MSRLRLGGIWLPLDIITMRTSVFGVSGSGKSTFGRLLAEAVHDAGQRFCVIDLKNDWWGLKSSSDGKTAAIPVIVIGGPRADIPLDADAGAAVADIVAEVQQSFVIDLDALSKGKGIRFLGAFLERLYDANRDPLLLICDEADRYGPQKPMSVEANVTLGAADDIARRGRKRGIGSLWLSQRPAVINKNITSQCELVVTFRTPSELDQKELRAHIGRVASAEQVAETMRMVGGLADGEAIFMSQHPQTRMFKTVQLPMPRTFDSSATPRVGQRRIEPKRLAAPDLHALGERITAAAEKAKVTDPIHLRRRITELEAELRKGKVADPAAIEKARAVGARDAERRFVAELARASRAEGAILRLRAKLKTHSDKLGWMSGELATDVAELGKFRTEAPKNVTVPRVVSAPARHIPATTTRTPASSNGRLGVGERRILTAIAQHGDGVTREQLTILTGYKRSTRDTYLKRLGAGGYVGLDGGRILATDLAVVALGSDFRPLPVGDELRAHWLRVLPDGERKILEALVTKYPDAAPRDWLSEVTEYQRSTRDTYLQRLSARRLVETIGRGEVRAAKELFSP